MVQTLLLVKLAILKLLTPDISDFADKTKNSDFKMLLPALHKHMHNPSWEIRDSCIEVITTIVELIEQSKLFFFSSLKINNLR